ncbi:MAG: DUF2970 domain-containing protein [Alphaproteobacteria bacterium]|nr:MAG: DUF2970 domain-containing protein [Alphaproteobacteria bacterium]
MTSEEDRKRRRVRNYVVGGILVALVVLFYLITIVKMSGS